MDKPKVRKAISEMLAKELICFEKGKFVKENLMEILLADQRKKQIAAGNAGYTIYGNRIVIYKCYE